MYHRRKRQSLYAKYKRGNHGHSARGRSRSYVPRRNRGYLGPYSGIKYSVSKVMQTKVNDCGINAGVALELAQYGNILTFENFSLSPSTNTASLIPIPQGTAYNNRIGNNVRVTAVRAHIQFNIPAASVAGDIVRIIVYLDKQANGVAATASQILQPATGTTVTISSYQNWFYVDRFKILHDETMELNPPTSVTATEVSCAYFRDWKWSHKCSMPIRYSATTGALTELQSYNLGILVVTLIGNAFIPTNGSWIRTYFKDEQ